MNALGALVVPEAVVETHCPRDRLKTSLETHVKMPTLTFFFIFYVGPPKESIFLTTIYGLSVIITHQIYRLHFFIVNPQHTCLDMTIGYHSPFLQQPPWQPYIKAHGCMISQKWYGYINPKRDLNLVPSRVAIFEDCKATTLTTQPPRLDANINIGRAATAQQHITHYLAPMYPLQYTI